MLKQEPPLDFTSTALSVTRLGQEKQETPCALKTSEPPEAIPMAIGTGQVLN